MQFLAGVVSEGTDRLLRRDSRACPEVARVLVSAGEADENITESRESLRRHPEIKGPL